MATPKAPLLYARVAPAMIHTLIHGGHQLPNTLRQALGVRSCARRRMEESFLNRFLPDQEGPEVDFGPVKTASLRNTPAVGVGIDSLSFRP